MDPVLVRMPCSGGADVDGSPLICADDILHKHDEYAFE
jgi:hypothetical protein